MVAISLLNRFYSDQFLFWSAVFIITVFLSYFVLGIRLKNANRFEKYEDAMFFFSIMQALDFLAALLYFAGFAKGSHGKIEQVSGCYLIAFFYGIAIWPALALLFYFTNKGSVLLGLAIRNITKRIFKRKMNLTLK